MPQLFALSLDEALEEISAMLRDDELVFAYFDDVYLLIDRERARELFDAATACIESHTAIRTHLAKLRVWGAGSADPPPGIAELGAEV